MINNIVYNPSKLQRSQIEHYKDQAQSVSVDANYWAVREGGALSTAVWTVLEGDASVGADTESNNVSTALVTTGTEGYSLIEVKLTLDSSGGDQIGIQYIEFNVPVVNNPAIRY